MSKATKQRRLILGGLLILVAAIFIAFSELYSRKNSPTAVIQRLTDSGKITKLKKWRTELFYCEKNLLDKNCKAVGEFSYDLDLPDVMRIGKIVGSIQPAPTHATLVYDLNEEETLWLRKQGFAALVIPRMVHISTNLKMGGKDEKASGLGSSVTLNIDPRVVNDTQRIKLNVSFKGYPYFGPMELPIALVESNSIGEYQELTARNFMIGSIYRAQLFTVFLLLVAMAFILDHSAGFFVLALYVIGGALRNFIPVIVQSLMSGQKSLVLDGLYVVANSITAFCVPLFIAVIMNFLPQRKYLWSLFMVITVALFGNYFAKKDVLEIDLYSDIAACIVGSLVLFYGHYRFAKAAEQQTKDSGSSYLLEQGLLYFRTLLLLTAMAFTFWANVSDLFNINADAVKDFLNWKHAALLPALIIAALFEVGSTSKAMLVFAKKMVKQALVEKDLEMGRQVQLEMLPKRRQTGDFWSWRTYYVPASTLAGDWFDLRELTISGQRKILIGCVADVTGHGLGAAMMTSTISSHWGRFCQVLVERPDILEREGKAAMVKTSLRMIHDGLTSLRSSKGCTAAVFVYDPVDGELFYATPGHPGIVIQRSSNKEMKYLAAKGSRLGGEIFEVDVGSVNVQQGDQVFVLTDGIVTPGQVPTQWLKHCQRTADKKKISLAAVLLNSMRVSKRHFRLNPQVEDDMTLVMLKIGISAAQAAADTPKIA